MIKTRSRFTGYKELVKNANNIRTIVIDKAPLIQAIIRILSATHTSESPAQNKNRKQSHGYNWYKLNDVIQTLEPHLAKYSVDEKKVSPVFRDGCYLPLLSPWFQIQHIDPRILANTFAVAHPTDLLREDAIYVKPSGYEASPRQRVENIAKSVRIKYTGKPFQS